MTQLHVEASIAGQLTRSEPATISVEITNISDAPVLVNRRLAPGYRSSDARELWADLSDEIGEPAAIATIDYEREYAQPGDYAELPPGASFAGQFDLFHYARPQKPGTYVVTVVYEADEPTPHRPDGVVAGEHAADPITIDVA